VPPNSFSGAFPAGTGGGSASVHPRSSSVSCAQPSTQANLRKVTANLVDILDQMSGGSSIAGSSTSGSAKGTTFTLHMAMF
jgi:hypothetical protein